MGRKHERFLGLLNCQVVTDCIARLMDSHLLADQLRRDVGLYSATGTLLEVMNACNARHWLRLTGIAVLSEAQCIELRKGN